MDHFPHPILFIIIIIIVIIIILLTFSFSHQHWLLVFHRNLSDNKSSQVCRTFLSVLTDLKNAVVWSFWQLFQTRTNICYHRHPHVPQFFFFFGFLLCFVLFFFRSLARSKYFVYFSLSFIFTLWSAGTSKSTRWQFLIFFLIYLFILWINIRSSLVALIRWPVCITKSLGILYVSYSRTDSGLCMYHW